MVMAVMGALDKLLRSFRRGKPKVPFVVLFKKFRSILDRNNRILELMADMGDKLGGEYVFDATYIQTACEELTDQVFKLISDFSILNQRQNVELFMAFEAIRLAIQEELAGRHRFPDTPPVLMLDEITGEAGEAVGGKNAVLAEARNVLKLSTPQGFAITALAFAEFMRANDLPEFIDCRAERLDQEGEAVLDKVTQEVREAVLAAEVPSSVVRAVADACRRLAEGMGREPRFAVRSSAWGEDGDHSFAGMFESVLNVSPKNIPQAFKRVVASAYTPAAWLYRRNRGYKEHELVMAVGCHAMIDSRMSGAMYTYAPFSPEKEAVFINAAWGLCAPVVEGLIETDTYVVEREPPFTERWREVADKSRMMVLDPKGSTAWRDVSEEQRREPCLNQEQTCRLAEMAMTLENYFKRPQDVEWTMDGSGALFLLQSRPLQYMSRTMPSQDIDQATKQAEVIFEGLGKVAQRGIAIGKVHIVHNEEDLANFPAGAILVASHTTPRFARVMGKAQGILTDIGSPTGHMATIAREHRVPAIVDCGVATKLLHEGEEITLDATQNVVYRGAVEALRYFELTEEEVFEDSYEYRLLRRLLKKITPLNLVDPHGPSFAPEACRTFHDIARYIHEAAVRQLTFLSSSRSGLNEAAAKRLNIPIPLGLSVIDLDGWSGPDEKRSEIGPESIHCQALTALLEGLTSPGAWATEPVPVDMGSLMSSITRTFSPAQAASETIGRNLAVVSKEYLNLHLHLGYHFTIVDAYIGPNMNENSIYFRFLGGVSDMIRLSRRARFIAEVLEQFHFRVTVRGDLVVARLKKHDMPRMLATMKVIGQLIGYTRQLDVRLNDDAQMAEFTGDFIKRIAAPTEDGYVGP
jgi:pyruvate,water dikinase